MTQLVNRGLAGDDPAVQGRAMDVTVELPVSVGEQTAVLQMQIRQRGPQPMGPRETQRGPTSQLPQPNPPGIARLPKVTSRPRLWKPQA